MENVPEYHPSCELREQAGYWPNLDAEHKAALKEMHERVVKNSVVLRTEENLTLMLLRFLRARNFNVERAWNMFTEDVAWREENQIHLLCSSTAEQVLGCDPVQAYRYFPTWLQGFDKQGRPVAYRQYGYFEIWELLKLTSMEQLVRFHTWEVEQQVYLLQKQTLRTGFNVETFVIVVDARNWGVRLATRDAYRYIKGMVDVDSNHYPERLGRIFIINAPTTLALAWRIISKWTDPVTTRKISILADAAEWQPMLFETVDPLQVPVMYGGSAPDPTEESLRAFDPEAMLAAYSDMLVSGPSSQEDEWSIPRGQGVLKSQSSADKHHTQETKQAYESETNSDKKSVDDSYYYATTKYLADWGLWLGSGMVQPEADRMSQGKPRVPSGDGIPTPDGSNDGEDDTAEPHLEPLSHHRIDPTHSTARRATNAYITPGGIRLVYEHRSDGGVFVDAEQRTRSGTAMRTIGTQTRRKKRKLSLRGRHARGCCVIS